MKSPIKPTALPFLTLGAGFVGLALQVWLLVGAVDDRGLLVPGHPAGILLLLLAAAVLAVLLLIARSLTGQGRYDRLFPVSLPGAAGSLIAGMGIVVTVFFGESHPSSNVLGILTGILGVLAALSLVILADCRRKRQRPSFLLYGIVTVYFMLNLVCQYQTWSPEPQVQYFWTQLLASVCLMLTCYHRAALTANMGSRVCFVFFSQAALFFCCLSLASSNWLYYLTMGMWMASDLCYLGPLSRSRPKPKEPPKPEGAENP